MQNFPITLDCFTSYRYSDHVCCTVLLHPYASLLQPSRQEDHHAQTQAEVVHVSIGQGHVAVAGAHLSISPSIHLTTSICLCNVSLIIQSLKGLTYDESADMRREPVPECLKLSVESYLREYDESIQNMRSLSVRGLGRTEGRGPGHVVLRTEDAAAPVPVGTGQATTAQSCSGSSGNQLVQARGLRPATERPAPIRQTQVPLTTGGKIFLR